MTLRTRTIAAAVTAALASLGAAQTASAYNFTSSAGGPAVPVGTAFTATGGAMNWHNGATGAVWMTCTGSSFNGSTGGSEGTSQQLDMTGGALNGCRVGAQNVFMTVNASASAPWSIVPTSGSSSPFSAEVQNVNMTIRCGTSTATPATYSGTLTSGVTYSNAVPGSKINWSSAGSLTKSGSGCPVLPATVALTQEIKITSVGGSPVSATNNLWLNP